MCLARAHFGETAPFEADPHPPLASNAHAFEAEPPPPQPQIPPSAGEAKKLLQPSKTHVSPVGEEGTLGKGFRLKSLVSALVRRHKPLVTND